MKINKNNRLLFSDTLIPDIFIAEYLPALDGLAVKVYVYFALTAKNNTDISDEDIAKRLGSDTDSIRAALTELAAYGLIDINDKGFTVTDIKSKEMEKVYKLKTAKNPSDIIDKNNFSERNKMVSDINKTFFSGIMSPTWYSEIDDWFDSYQFDAQVIYALFNECTRRGKLNSKAYISKVAQNWSEIGIKTYDDLNRYFMTYDKVEKLSRKIGQKLRKNITEYDRELISVWINKMGYNFDIMDIALKKTSKLANPNLEYTDKLLKEWFSHGLITVEKIKEYEKVRKEEYFAKKNSENSEKKSTNVANFEQREYSEDYIEQMIEDPLKHV